MLLVRHRPRSSLRHLTRLRRRDDVGLGGIAAFGTVVVAMLVSTLAHAEPVTDVRVVEQPSHDVIVTVTGAKAPTFQIFRLPGQDAFAVELPGTDLSRARRDLGKDGVLLEGASVDTDAKRAPRVVVRFFGEVDYDAKSQGSTLTVTFTPLGDKGSLKQAWQQRRSASEAQSSAKGDLAATTKKLEEQRRAFLAMVKEFDERRQKEKTLLAALDERAKQTRAGLANLEQRKAEEEKHLAALASQRQEAEAKVASTHADTKRAEEQRKLALAAVARTENDLKRAQEELAKAKDKRALEEARTELAAMKTEMARVVEQRRAEEKRVTELRTSAARAKQELAALVEQQRVEQKALAALQQQQADERTRAAKVAAESQRTEQLLANVKQQHTFEQQRLDAMRKDVRRAAEELTVVEQRAAKEHARLAALQRSALEQQQALAQLDQRRQQTEQRLASLSRQASEAEVRAQAANARVARAPAPPAARPAVAPAPEPRRPPPPPVRRPPAQAQPRERIELASAEPSAVYGFGGKSVELAPPSRGSSNVYEPTDGYDDYRENEGLLSHVTVQRGTGSASRVGVRVDGGARYTVDRVSGREVVLTLFGTRAANLDVRRILDARDLGTTVLRVLPRVLEGGDNRIELTIEMRDGAPVRVAQDDAMLWVHVGS